MDNQHDGTAPYRAVAQSDGNLVVYGANAAVLWSSKSWIGSGNVQLKMQDDGNLVLFNGATVLWQSNSHGCVAANVATTTTVSPNVAKNTLQTNEVMTQGNCLTSSSKLNKACLTTDGNFVVYNSNGVTDWTRWSTQTNGKETAPFYCAQWDGNLVLYGGAANSVVWSSKSWIGNGSVHLTMEDNGDLVLYNGATMLRDSKTLGCLPTTITTTSTSTTTTTPTTTTTTPTTTTTTPTITTTTTPTTTTPTTTATSLALPIKSSLLPGDILAQGDCLTSPNRVNTDCMETSGNLVLYTTDGVNKWSLWATNTNTTGMGTGPYQFVNPKANETYK